MTISAMPTPCGDGLLSAAVCRAHSAVYCTGIGGRIRSGDDVTAPMSPWTTDPHGSEAGGFNVEGTSIHERSRNCWTQSENYPVPWRAGAP